MRLKGHGDTTQDPGQAPDFRTCSLSEVKLRCTQIFCTHDVHGLLSFQ